MSIKKIIITNGIYQDKELRLLVSFNQDDKPVDLVNLDITKVGMVYEASVEKVLSDIDSCILKLASKDKGFIENKKLNPDMFITRQSSKKLVCQNDKFYVRISQDKKGNKPYSCDFFDGHLEGENKNSFLRYYLNNFVNEDCEIISDDFDLVECNLDLNIRPYCDKDISLWELYGLTSILDKATCKIIYLKSGANIVIENTEALTVIDVNTSQSYGKSDAMSTNMEALVEIGRQMRLRSISGIIIVDLLKISKAQEDQLIEFAKKLFSDDLSKVAIHGFTRLGLLELTRSRLVAPFI